MARLMMDSLEKDDMLVSAGFTTQDAPGNGLLQIAALHGHFRISDQLLNRGININAVDRNHGTALQAAIYMGQGDICRQLLDWESPNATTSQQSQVGLKERINVNMKGGYFGCALQVAAYMANEDLVRELVGPRHRADVNIFGGKYGYPLQAAVQTGRMAVVRHILPRSNVNFKGGKYGSAMQAVARGIYRERTFLPEISRGQALQHPAQSSPGHYVARARGDDASETDYVQVAEALFSEGARMDGDSGVLDNPINAATCSGSEAMLRLMLVGFETRSSEWREEKSMVFTKALLTAVTRSPMNQEGLVRLLIENGARIQYQTSEVLPKLPLEAAVTNGLLDVVNYLLKVRDTAGQYADILAESGIHGTALHAAIAVSKPGKEVMAECLILRMAEEWGAKQRPSSDTDNARNNMTSQAGAHASTVYSPITRNIDDKEIDWTIWDAEYGNLLQLATVSGLKSTVSLLLDYGADANVRDTSQRTALHLAAWFGLPQIARLLLDGGADANAKDEWGATPLDQAEKSLDGDKHPGVSEQDLQDVIQTLQGEIQEIDSTKTGMEFRGPKRIPGAAQTPRLGAKPVFQMPFWIPGVGFRATVVDFWESEEQECLLLRRPRIEDILHHRGVLDSIMTSRSKPDIVKNKLRWIHIPTNNMTWAEMIINTLCRDKNVAYKSLWGTDPFYSSPDFSPHTRLAPRCGRLVPDGPMISGAESQSTPLFMAVRLVGSMLYMH
ncbi:ankyrin [Acephala macrosclerotiorum]|nr:ankyrin [Acephala macrosclerotiorum]